MESHSSPLTMQDMLPSSTCKAALLLDSSTLKGLFDVQFSVEMENF